jgi:uncharacterized membrane protein
LESAPGVTSGPISFLKSHNGQRVTIAAFSIAATLVLALLPGGPFAFIFGLPYMFFVPGFTVIRLFFWRGTSLEAKFVLSLGLSILVLIMLALILVLTPIGLAPESAIGSLVVFTLAAVALETTLLKADRPRKGESKEAEPEPEPETHGKPDRVVAAMIVTALVVSAVSLGFIVTADYPVRTSFALTDEDGKVVTNTTRPELTSLTLVFHVKNGEDGQRNFTVNTYASNIYQPGTPVYENKTYSASLAKGAGWDQAVTVYFNYSTVFKINFDLYIQEQGQAAVFYGNLHIWFIAP